MTDSFKKDIEHISVNYPLKMRMLNEHGELLHRQMVELKHCLFELQNGELKDALAIEEVSAEVMPLLNEIRYLNDVIEAVHEDKHDDAMFSHFVENLDAYREHVQDNFGSWKLVRKLKQQEHLLKTLYHKEELKHNVNQMVEKYGHEKAGAVVHHFIESHSMLKHSSRLELVELLSDRVVKLHDAAGWLCEKIVKQKIRDVNRKMIHGKRESRKLFSEGIRHYKNVTKLHDRLLT